LLTQVLILKTKDENPAVLFALSGALATRAEDSKMENIMKVTSKLPVEFQVVAVKGCMSKDKQLKTHPDVKSWIVKNANVIL